MDILIWFLRLFTIPFGAVCMFVSLDMLYIWGIEGPAKRKQDQHRPLGNMPGSQNNLSFLRKRQNATRPHPNTWVWWEWQIRRPAFYLLLLGFTLIFSGVLLWLPSYGSILWVSERIVGITVLLLGLILLRGTVKITSPLLWRKITIIKRPLSGRAHPSLIWMGIGFVVTLTGLYGMACNFTSISNCMNDKMGVVFDLLFTTIEFVVGGMAAVGLEDVVQSFQEGSNPEPRSVALLGMGLVLFITALVLKAVVA